MATLIMLILLGGGNFYVATDGSDTTGDGSEGNPWATITHALDSVPDESLILVKPGTYTGRIRLRGVFTNGVTVRSQVPYQARLRHDSAVITCYEGIGITLEGFDVAHLGPGSGALVIQVQDLRGAPGGVDATSRITFRNNIIHDSYNNDLLKINNGARDIHVVGNLFFNQSGSDEHIDLNGATDTHISDNIFFNYFEGSGRSNGNDTSSFVVIKNSGGHTDHGSHRVERNIFLNWQGSSGSNFLLLGEDGHPFFETQDILVQNNLMLGNADNVMRASFGVKGCRDIVFRNNTIVGDLPSAAFAMRLNREGANPANENIRFYNNIWSDPSGSMGAQSQGGSPDFSDTPPDDTLSFELDTNLYWNGPNPIPSDGSELVNIDDDLNAEVGDPGLADQTGLVLPYWDGNQFPSGSIAIVEEHQRLATTYGRPANAVVVAGLARPDQAPVDDILGQTRGAEADLGAFETAECLGDQDGDGDVDSQDLLLALPAWRTAAAIADLDGDALVTVLDLTTISSCQ